ncbi:MAG: hypothetical protein WDO73_37805 [Ignavibacteriota bacterium]
MPPPANLIKGHRTFGNLDDAKAYVLKRRAELRAEWEAKTEKVKGEAAFV